jgi:lysophospholipase L1-like esterase
MRRRALLLVLLAGVVLAIRCTRENERPDSRPTAAERWEPAIREFERQDAVNPPPRGEIVFVGSSSIVGWDVQASFPDLGCINRGFGGSYMEDAARYADRIVVPYRPRVVVVYSGDNDIAHGRTPDQVIAAARSLVADLHAKLPETRIVLISIKPSPRRWHLFAKMQEANRGLAALARNDAQVRFVDVTAAMLGADGNPRPELYVDDGLHLTPAGYALWASLVRPELDAVPPRNRPPAG